MNSFVELCRDKRDDASSGDELWDRVIGKRVLLAAHSPPLITRSFFHSDLSRMRQT